MAFSFNPFQKNNAENAVEASTASFASLKPNRFDDFQENTSAPAIAVGGLCLALLLGGIFFVGSFSSENTYNSAMYEDDFYVDPQVYENRQVEKAKSNAGYLNQFFCKGGALSGFCR